MRRMLPMVGSAVGSRLLLIVAHALLEDGRLVLAEAPSAPELPPPTRPEEGSPPVCE